MLMDDTHVVHHPFQESADRPGITRSRSGSLLLHVFCCLVHQAREVTSRSGQAGASGFTALMDVQQAGWTASSWAYALSRSNVPAGGSPRIIIGGKDAKHPCVDHGEAMVWI
jgi:hypothetical protein